MSEDVDVAWPSVGLLPRERFALGLAGDVLEVGPGTTPFPTVPGAVVRFADRPLAGGRDVNFPELVGAPRGPDADFELDLDVDGLVGIADRSVDAVVLSHVIEHVANPIHALEECLRVLRPAGRLVLIVPLRHATFDALRPGTSLAHLLAEHEAGVTDVDVEHIREFCHSVYHHRPDLPSEVLEWHDPDRLDDDRVALHRRRSIHVHCWDAEEMAATLVGLAAAGTVAFRLVDLFFDDDAGASDIEFGLVLEPAAPGPETAMAFIDAWVGAVLGDATRDAERIASLTAALARDLPDVLGTDKAGSLVGRPALVAARLLREAQAEGRALATARAEVEARADRTAAELAARDRELTGVLQSRTHRAGQAVTAPVRLLRRIRG